MARYIDADDLYKWVKTLTNPYGKPTLDYKSGVKVLDMINREPTADVVPRAEVEELIRENKSLAKTVNEASELIRKLRSKVEKSKTKVTPTVSKMEQVRSMIIWEILEEIGKSVASKIPPHIHPIFKDDRNFEDGFRDGKTDALIEVLMIIAELKKKYTERSEEDVQNKTREGE